MIASRLVLSTFCVLCTVPVLAQTIPGSAPGADATIVASQPTPLFQTFFNGPVIILQPGTRAWVLPKGAAGEQSSICYTMQTYRFAHGNPETNEMKLVGHSSCQAAAQYQVKPATGSR
jgi:hypothetical protein